MVAADVGEGAPEAVVVVVVPDGAVVVVAADAAGIKPKWLEKPRFWRGFFHPG